MWKSNFCAQSCRVLSKWVIFELRIESWTLFALLSTDSMYQSDTLNSLGWNRFVFPFLKTIDDDVCEFLSNAKTIGWYLFPRGGVWCAQWLSIQEEYSELKKSIRRTLVQDFCDARHHQLFNYSYDRNWVDLNVTPFTLEPIRSNRFHRSMFSWLACYFSIVLSKLEHWHVFPFVRYLNDIFSISKVVRKRQSEFVRPNLCHVWNMRSLCTTRRFHFCFFIKIRSTRCDTNVLHLSIAFRCIIFFV